MRKELVLFLISLLICACSKHYNSERVKTVAVTDSINYSQELYNLYNINSLSNINGLIYVADSSDESIKVFNYGDFSPLYRFGEKGKGPNEYNMLRNIAKKDTILYISDVLNNRIQMTNRTGKYLGVLTSHICWSLKEINGEIYYANASFLPVSKIYKMEPVNQFREIFDYSSFCTKNGIKMIDRPYNFWINMNNDIIIALEVLGKIFKISQNNIEEISLPEVCKQSKVLLGDIKKYKRGFIIAGMTFSPELKQLTPFFAFYNDKTIAEDVFFLPNQLAVTDLLAWDIFNNHLIVVNKEKSMMYKLKLN